MSPDQFPPLLKQERDVRGWSQREVAKRLGAERITVIRWERGLAFPSVHFRGELCKLFGECMEQFFRRVAPDPLKAHLPVEPAMASMVSDEGIVHAEHQFELVSSKEHRTEYQTRGDTHSQSSINQEIFIDKEIQQFTSDKNRLELQEKSLELQSKCIEYTIKIANLMINVLDPTCDASVRSLTIGELLTALQQAYEEGIQEPFLPTFQSVGKALDTVRRAKVQTGSSQKGHDASLQKEVLETFNVDILPLQTNNLASQGLNDIPERSQESSNHRDTVMDDSSVGVRTERALRNPYGRFTAILNPEEFVGRSQMVQDIYAALVNGQSVSLVGLRNIGKSSVLHYLCTSEAQQRCGYGTAFHKHLFVLKDIREFSQWSGDGFFAGVNAEIISQVKDRLTLVLPEKKGEEGFSDLLGQIRDLGFHLVLLLDEFDKIPQFNPAFFGFLHAQADLGRVSYVVASRRPLHEFSPDPLGLSFFNIFRVYRLGPLTLSEAQELITVPAQRVGLPFTEEEVEWTLAMVGCHPFFIQCACLFIFDEKMRQGNEPVDLKLVGERVYYELEPHFVNAWDTLGEDQKQDVKLELTQSMPKRSKMPELSECSLFRKKVRAMLQVNDSEFSLKDVKDVLDHIDDNEALENSRFAELHYIALSMKTNPQTKRGVLVRELLKAGFERMKAGGVRSDSAPEWRLYNILLYHYFRYHLANSQTSARLGIGSMRQFYREQDRALQALLKEILDLEQNALNKDI